MELEQIVKAEVFFLKNCIKNKVKKLPYIIVNFVFNKDKLENHYILLEDKEVVFMYIKSFLESIQIENLYLSNEYFIFDNAFRRAITKKKEMIFSMEKKYLPKKQKIKEKNIEMVITTPMPIKDINNNNSIGLAVSSPIKNDINSGRGVLDIDIKNLPKFS